MRRLWWGLFLLILGVWIWLSKLGVPYVSFSRNWPLILIAFGVYLIVRTIRRRQRRSGRGRVRVIIDQLEEGRIGVEEAITEIMGENDD